MVKRDNKPLGEYNSHDVREEFLWLYSKHHNKPYQPKGFIGHDLKLIKQAISDYGLFAVLAGFYNGIRDNSDSVSIKYLIRGFEFKYYLTPHNPEMYYKIMAYGNPKVKAAWRKYLLLESRWLPDAESERKKNNIKTKLLEWSHAKEE